jgi:leucyl/phenylalanyl-tRNA---protein transferase
MPLFALDKELIFPPAHLAEPDGMLAMGGDLSPERILLAYRNGIFPWYDGPVIIWWSPDPRCVLFPQELLVSKSMQVLLKRKAFRFTTNTAFAAVIHHCKTTRRAGQSGTWITDEVEKAYTRLHQMGHAHSAEAWLNGELVGGLYGIRIGKVFFGESMFSTVSNASKYAFIQYVRSLQAEGVQLIDCQMQTPHLESLGARMMARETFLRMVQELI